MNLAILKEKYEKIVRCVLTPSELEKLTESALALAIAELVEIVGDEAVEPGVRVNAAAVLASYGRLMTQRAALRAQLEIERMRLQRRGGEILIEEVPIDASQALSAPS